MNVRFGPSVITPMPHRCAALLFVIASSATGRAGIAVCKHLPFPVDFSGSGRL